MIGIFRFSGAALLLGGAFLFSVGCGGTAALHGPEAAASAGSVIKGVPFLPQEEDTCGPSSLAMVLRFHGGEDTTSALARETRTAGLKGTLITDLAAAARRRDFAAEIEDLDMARLKARISTGVPVILLVDLGTWVFSQPHYLLAYGWTRQGVVAHSGREEGKVIPFEVLDSQWSRMGHLALTVRRHKN